MSPLITAFRARLKLKSFAHRSIAFEKAKEGLCIIYVLVKMLSMSKVYNSDSNDDFIA